MSNKASMDEIRQVIATWMHGCIQEQGYKRFDDLHIDQIAPEFRDRSRWLPSSLQALEAAFDVRQAENLPFTVALGMSLASGSNPRGRSFQTLNDVATELDWSPPSLYLFEPGDYQWLGEGQSVELGPEYRPPALSSVRAFLREWYDEDDLEYRRSFWLAG